MPFVTANNTFGTLAVGMTATTPVVQLGAGQGVFFNFLTDAQHYTYGTLIHVADNSTEVVRLTGPVAGDQLIIDVGGRGADGTVARSFSVGDRIEIRIPRAVLNLFITGDELQYLTSLRATSVAGSPNAITAVHAPPITIYGPGLASVFTPISNNTGPTTYKPDALAAANVFKFGGQNLDPNDIVTGWPAVLLYASTLGSWELLNPLSSPIPAGIIMDFGGTAAPSGYLLCDGSSVLRATYPNLFTAIGVAFGSADGTHFNVPDFRRRVAVGVGGTGSATLANTVGATGGEEAHVQVSNEMASHTHHIRINNATGGSNGQLGSVGSPILTTLTAVDTGGSFINTAHTGESAAANIMQPSLVVTKIIKF